MSRRVFKKALNRIESRSYESNISRLNDELKKTGMLSERMTTSTVLPPTETQPFIPPTSSPAPLGDLSDLNTFAWDNAAQGNGSSISHDFSQLATTDVNGETKSILEIPSISTTDGTGFTGTVYGLAFGPNLGVSGNPLGYINENGFNSVYQYQNVFSVTHTEFSRALVDYYEDNAFTSKVIYLWGPLLYRVAQPIQPAAFYPSGSDFNSQPIAQRGLYGYTLLIPVDSNGNIKRNNIITDLGQPRTIVLNRLDDPSSPDYYEGDFSRFLANLLDVGKQAFDYLVGASDDFLAGDAIIDALGNFLEPLSAVTYAADAFRAFLGQQQGTVNYTEDNPKKVSMPSQDKQAISNALNDVMQDIPLERWENLTQEDLDKINNILNPSSGPTPSNPDIPDGARTKRIDEYHLIFNNIGKSDAFEGQIKTDKNGDPYVAGIKDNYVFTNDADASVAGAPALINFFANAFGAQDRMGDTPYEYTSGDPNDELDQLKRNQEKYPNNPELWDTSDSQVTFKLKNMPILMDIPAPNNNRTTKESFTISEGWQSPDHTNVEKDSKTRWFNPNAGTDSAKWFDPKEVKPAYPAKAPPKMIDGYSATSNLAPKPVKKSPAIKLTKKDLLRNHKLKDSEVAGMMQTIARLNKFIADHPEELIYAKSRYPKHDPRLAELNWNMDQMLKASGDYLDKQFPENERLFDKVKSATKRSIDLTDPETYKKDPGDLSSIGNLARVDHVMNYYEPKDRTVSKIKMENRKSVNRFFEKPKRPDRPAFLRKKK